MHILIAEDNPDNLDMLQRRLERKGFTIDCARDGGEAVEQVRAVRPDLVLMDVSMPVMSGLDATKAVRSDPDIAATPIIALTAHAMASDRDRCLEAGCDGFATKPVDFPALIALIKDVAARAEEQG